VVASSSPTAVAAVAAVLGDPGRWLVVRGWWFVVGGSWLVVRGWWFVVRGSWFVGGWWLVVVRLQGLIG
jgi:hypothetical protein